MMEDIFNWNAGEVYNPAERQLGAVDNSVYKTRPKDSKSDDGHYRSLIRLVSDPSDKAHSIIETTQYAFTDEDGSFILKSSLSNGDTSCPIFKYWKKFRYHADPNIQALAKGENAIFRREYPSWVLVQVIEDNNQPDMVGKILRFKLPNAIKQAVMKRMCPAADARTRAYPMFDPILGLAIEIDVTPGPKDPMHPERETREISYDACEVTNEAATMTKLDGTPIFEDAEQAVIDDYITQYNKIYKEKDDKKRAKLIEAFKSSESAGKISALYEKVNAYIESVKSEIATLEPVKYKPWTDEETARWEKWKADTDMRVFGAGAQAAATEAVAPKSVEQAVGDGSFDIQF